MSKSGNEYNVARAINGFQKARALLEKERASLMARVAEIDLLLRQEKPRRTRSALPQTLGGRSRLDEAVTVLREAGPCRGKDIMNRLSVSRGYASLLLFQAVKSGRATLVERGLYMAVPS